MCFCLPGAPPQDLVSISSVRFWSLAHGTRVAIELSGEARYKWEKLHDPERLFVDVVDAQPKLEGKAFRTFQVGDRLVKQVRVARKDPRTARVVLDLATPVDHEISLLTNPNRIMIEVRAKGVRAQEILTQSRPAVKPEAPPKAPDSAPGTAERKIETAAVKEPPKEAAREAGPPARPAVPEEGAAKSDAAPLPQALSAAPPPQAPTAAPPLQAPTAAPAPAQIAAAVPGGADNASPKGARPTSSGTRSMTRALGLKIGRVVLDPGHGGHDHGTTGPGGTTEKELVLDIALRLGALIEQRLGSEVLYTRETDQFIPLEERTAKANGHRADLFLSIHANSSPVKGISGAEVYYLNFTTSRESLDVAARENASHGKSIFELREIIQKIALTDKLDESKEFATRVQASLSSTWSKMNASAKNRGVKKAPFVVLIGAAMPSILAEIGFLSNSRDEAALRKPDQRQRIAEALFKGVQQYATGLGHTQSALGALPASGNQSTR